ncbi:MAG: hypothetical protein PHW19_00395 [Salinivirgaceae bacterium]|nr:hypothetical protein [Salinivirgaceae bacterium]
MKRIIIFIYLISISAFSVGQQWREINDLDNEATMYMYEHQYLKSAELFEIALSKLPQSDNFKYKAGLSYYKSIDSINRAISYFEEASKNMATAGLYNYNSVKELRAPIDVLFFLARSYQAIGKYQKAEAVFHDFKSKTFEEDELKLMADQQIRNMKFAELSKKNPINVKFESIGDHINNELPNYNAVFSGDGYTMAYTSSTDDGLKVFIALKVKSGWGNPKDITWDIGSGYLKTAWLSYDGKTLYLIEDNMQQLIMVSHFENGVWGVAKKMKKPINGRGNQASVTVTNDGQKIYFTSNCEGGVGGYDIYFSKKNVKGKWDEPVNMGPFINTPLNEEFVALSPSENKLYFSSEGYENIGGSDIFEWEIGSEDGPQNIGFPINNAFNNIFFHPIDENTAVFNDIRSEGKGQLDIYKATFERSYKLISEVFINKDSNLLVDIAVKNDSDSTFLLQLDQNSSGRINIGSVPAGNYTITFTGNEISPHVEKISIEESNPKSDIVFFVNLQSNKPIEELIAEVEKESEIVNTSFVITPAEQEPTITQVSEVKMSESIEVKAAVPEKKPMSVVQTVVEEKSTIYKADKTPEPKKSDVYVERTKHENSNAVATPKISIPKQSKNATGTYTIQFMALDLPISLQEVTHMGNVHIFACPEGLYRYTTGLFESKESAFEMLRNVQVSYPQAFICTIPLKGKYVIQCLALKKPKEILNVIEERIDISMMHGADDYYRYFIGGFETIEKAKLELSKVHEKGYFSAYVRQIPK